MPAAAAAAAADALSLLMYWLLLVRRFLVQLQLLLRIVSYLTTSTVLAQQRQMCFEPPVTSVLAQYWPWDRVG